MARELDLTETAVRSWGKRADCPDFRLDTLDDDPAVKPTLHALVACMAPWYDIADRLAQYERLPAHP